MHQKRRPDTQKDSVPSCLQADSRCHHSRRPNTAPLTARGLLTTPPGLPHPGRPRSLLTAPAEAAAADTASGSARPAPPPPQPPEASLPLQKAHLFRIAPRLGAEDPPFAGEWAGHDEGSSAHSGRPRGVRLLPAAPASTWAKFASRGVSPAGCSRGSHRRGCREREYPASLAPSRGLLRARVHFNWGLHLTEKTKWEWKRMEFFLVVCSALENSWTNFHQTFKKCLWDGLTKIQVKWHTQTS
ncbi:uncharacterized protein LOC123620202 [Lemur catta]|uniref:uncharacterized protein LOC123620202 n=1 Tax=Lemur catta TaxID=9447 RepID=UPI001E26AEA5|nr:uncharacterized protein LOC123620202 [Lemur catta]